MDKWQATEYAASVGIWLALLPSANTAIPSEHIQEADLMHTSTIIRTELTLQLRMTSSSSVSEDELKWEAHLVQRRAALKRMLRLREQAITKGMELWDEDRLQLELASRRGE